MENNMEKIQPIEIKDIKEIKYPVYCDECNAKKYDDCYIFGKHAKYDREYWDYFILDGFTGCGRLRKGS